MSEPNLEHIRAWIEALESGKYMQGSGALCRSNGINGMEYCCLGVACEVAIADGVPLRKEMGERDASHFAPIWEYVYVDAVNGQEYRNGDVLPIPVSDWLGLDDNNPTLPNLWPMEEDEDDNWQDQGYLDATEVNDDRGWDFDQIAAALRNRFGLPRVNPNQETLPV